MLKKIISLLLILLMVFSLASCKKAETPKIETPKVEENTKTANIKNPIKSFETLEELNSKYGFNLNHPGVMGVEDVAYQAIEKSNLVIGEYIFKINGMECRLRVADTMDDICGVYVDGKTALADANKDDDGLDAHYLGDGFKIARWVDGSTGLQYCINIKDEGKYDEATFLSIVDEMKFVTEDKELAGTTVMNPIQEYASVDELNQKNGLHLNHPGVMGVEDIAAQSICTPSYCIYEYIFSINGMKCNLRCAATTDDISGVYVNGNTIFYQNEDSEASFFGDGFKAGRWFNIDGQYCFTVYDDGKYDETTFNMILDEMKDVTFPGMTESEKTAYYSSLQGTYADKTSQRATADITAEKDCAKVIVHWGSSANETTIWEMSVKLGEDGLLYYSDCIKSNYDFTTNPETVTKEYENGSGFFGLGQDNLLYWNGAEEESCQACVFEKIG